MFLFWWLNQIENVFRNEILWKKYFNKTICVFRITYLSFGRVILNVFYREENLRKIEIYS